MLVPILMPYVMVIKPTKCWVATNVLGDPQVTANNHATFTVSALRRLRDYLRLLMRRPLP